MCVEREEISDGREKQEEWERETKRGRRRALKEEEAAEREDRVLLVPLSADLHRESSFHASVM